MVAYNSNELFSATEVAKNFATITSKLYKNELEKVGILKNNKLDFILLKSEDFEKIIEKEVRRTLFEEDRKFKNELFASCKDILTNDKIKTIKEEK